jgi:leucine-zipper of insertion element IS481
MSKARLVITAVTVEKRPVSEVAKSCGVARSWACKLLARYQAEGEAAFEPRSRRPKTSPFAISDDAADLIIRPHPTTRTRLRKLSQVHGQRRLSDASSGCARPSWSAR